MANSEYRLPEDSYDLVFVEGKNCTQVGAAYVKAVAKGPNVEGEKEFKYQIIKARLDRDYFQERMVTEFAYDGVAKQPLLEGDYPQVAEVEYLYYFDQWDNRMDGAPKDAGNYSCMVRLIPQDTEHYQNETWMQAFEITPKKLEADVQVIKSKVYDGWPNVESPQATATNLVEGDEVNLSATAKYDNKHAGTDKTITVSYRMSGKDAGNYLAPDEFALTDGEIIPRKLKWEILSCNPIITMAAGRFRWMKRLSRIRTIGYWQEKSLQMMLKWICQKSGHLWKMPTRGQINQSPSADLSLLAQTAATTG